MFIQSKYIVIICYFISMITSKYFLIKAYHKIKRNSNIIKYSISNYFSTINDDNQLDYSTSNEVLPGHIYFVATPIGNVNDISKRAIEILNNCDIICAEDTRHTINLLRLLKCNKKTLISHHEHNYNEQIPKIISLLKDNKSIAVVSDAGTPGISDPGTQLAHQCIVNSIPIHPIPGPSAVITALSVSGFDNSIFTFMGFLTVKGKDRKDQLDKIVNYKHTIILYEAPHRIISTLNDINKLPYQVNRPCLICRELTKVYEEFIHGTIDECINKLQSNNQLNRIKGEFTIILGPINDSNILDDEQTLLDSKIIDMLEKLHNDNVKRSEAVKIVSDIIGINSKSKIYKIALDIDWD